MFKLLSKINKMILPSFTKQGLNIIYAKKWQKALLVYRYWVTLNSLN